MKIEIEILSMTANNMGKYTMYELAFKKDGKVEGKKVPDFTIQSGKELLANAKQGTKLSVTIVKESAKDGKEYWQWKQIEASTGVVANTHTSTGSPAPRSTYETPEERKVKQDFIIRQSSLSSAIGVLTAGAKAPPKSVDVISLAEEFVGFVYGRMESKVDMNPANMEDDIPY